jgi:hypothetical protein
VTSKTITIGTILLFLAWLLAQTFFSAPAEQDPAIGVPVARICLALFLVGIGLIIVRTLFGFKYAQRKASEKTSSLYLKTYGSKITVDLSDCKITDEIDKIVIECQAEFKGQPKNFISSIVGSDVNKVRQKINHKRITTLYIDNKDSNKYYLDTEFLE